MNKIHKELYTTLNAMTIDEFLLWFKMQTEEAWHNIEEPTIEKCQETGYTGLSWRKDTKWIGGFSDDVIKNIERKWQITFPYDYSRYLSILGAPDKLYFSTAHKYDDWDDDTITQFKDTPSFYNWQKDTDDIIYAFDDPLEGILATVEGKSNTWIKSWGKRPNSPDERRKVLTDLINKAPKLIPISGHRYMLDYLVGSTNLFLSVHQTDIILYGRDLRNYLILEFHDLLNINDDDVYQNMIGNYDKDELRAIPFWGEIIYSNLYH